MLHWPIDPQGAINLPSFGKTLNGMALPVLQVGLESGVHVRLH